MKLSKTVSLKETMTLEQRKLDFIQEILLLEDLEVLSDLEKAIDEYNIQTLHSNIQPMSFEKFQNDIDQSIFDSENRRVISAEELRTKIKK